MNTRGTQQWALVVSLWAFAAGAAFAQDGVANRAGEPKIYGLGELNVDQYEVVGRPWVDDWHITAWSVPTYPTREQAVDALRTEAARRGANGVIVVGCLDQGRQRWSDVETAFLCYGMALRVRPK